MPAIISWQKVEFNNGHPDPFAALRTSRPRAFA